MESAPNPDKKLPPLKGLANLLRNKFFLAFLAVFILTMAAIGLRTYQQLSQIKSSPTTTSVSAPQVLTRRSKIPNIITRATTAKFIDTKTGKVIQTARIFSVGDKTVYLSLDLNKPQINTRIDYIRYLNGRYIDHGSVKITAPNTLNLAFEWTVNNPANGRPDGKYKIATYTNGILEKRVIYTVVKKKIAEVSVEDPVPFEANYFLGSKLLSQAN